jgi:hypothetical protein
MRKIAATGIATALAVLTFVPAASAVPAPEFEQFLKCPWENVEITDCVYWTFDDGSYSLGETNVPVVNPIVLQGGYTGEAAEDKFHGAINGNTLSKTPQPVPGGLGGGPAPTSWPPELQAWFNEMVETGFTGVNATIELAEPATAIELNYENLIFEEGTALGLPVKIKLDNAILGNNCYIGNNEEPVELALSTGTSGAVTGTPGEFALNPKATIFNFNGIEVVDGTYALPEAEGCGGVAAEFVDPLVNAIFGLPSGSEENAASFEGVLRDANGEAMRGP